MSILIVDDSPLVRAVLKDCLITAGFDVYEAGTVKEAELKFKRFHPEVVIKDLYMPGWDAIDSIKFFKRLDSNVKVIICSTGTSKAMILEGLRAGAQDFILKPIDRIQVIALMKRLV
jgi:two-component system, chemotaxis family, chemotaxis protein CheY